MRLLIVRHGESEMNVEQLLGGHMPTPLTPLGVEQAARLGERLASESIDQIYSSDLLRAKQTTDEISKKVAAPVVYDTRLRERTWGELDGTPHEQFRSLVENSTLPYHQFRPTGGESLEDLSARVLPFLEELQDRHISETVLLSAHHSVNKAMLAILLDIPWTDWSSITQANTCLNIVRVSKQGQAEVELLNCAAHLVD